jgi:hypothetical protein
MGRKAPEMLPFSMDTMRPYAVFTGELADGSEGMFACDLSDGYVYRMLDSGASFDGVQISAFVMTPFNHLGNIGMNKRSRGTIELDAAANGEHRRDGPVRLRRRRAALER